MAGKNHRAETTGKIDAPDTDAQALTGDLAAETTLGPLADLGEGAFDGTPVRGAVSMHDALLDERNDVLAVISELEEQLDRQQEIRDTLEREVRERTEQLQGASQRIQELEWQTVTLQTRIDSLENSRSEAQLLEEELAEAATRVTRLNEQLGNGEKERVALKNELKNATKQLEEIWAIRKERDGLRLDIKTLKTKFEDVERANRELTDERNQLQIRAQDAQNTIEALRIERHELQTALRAADDRQREYARGQEALVEKIETLREEKKQIHGQLATVERENQRLMEQRQTFENELLAMRSMNRTSEAALTNVKKAFAEVRIALAETKARARRRSLDTITRTGASPTSYVDTTGWNGPASRIAPPPRTRTESPATIAAGAVE